MLRILQMVTKKYCLNGLNSNFSCKINVRTFLSQSYYCREVWDHRLNSSILQKIDLADLYNDLDHRFQKIRQMSAVDVDIFANAITDNLYVNELLDLVHKLRLSADTSNTLNSTAHAVVRVLLQCGREAELVNVLDDRLNYGLFLDYYTSNILLDTFWKAHDFLNGARVASQLMLQEEFNHDISRALSLLHCYNYLLKPEGWPEYPKPEEPEEEVKIRVKFLRNPFNDDHFDLRDPNKIVGKTLTMFTKKYDDLLSKSLHILGLTLYGKYDTVKQIIEEYKSRNTGLVKEIIDLIPDGNEIKEDLKMLNVESQDVQGILKESVVKAVQEKSESDIDEQCKLFLKWEDERMVALEEQKKRLLMAKRLSDIENLKKAIKEKETKLWFFENEEKIELDIEKKRVYHPKRWFGKKKKPKKIDESYIPPEL